jgi:NAD(P)-dependent dehydrogenase (short-subunit alcohol dehydrogenase family)
VLFGLLLNRSDREGEAVRSCSSKTPAGRSSKSQLSRASVSQGRGSIVNISSTYGHEGAAGASVYVGSKHAVEGMTKSAALEAAGYGVRVNAVAPGPTDTGMLTRFTRALLPAPESAVGRQVMQVRQAPSGRRGEAR